MRRQFCYNVVVVVVVAAAKITALRVPCNEGATTTAPNSICAIYQCHRVAKRLSSRRENEENDGVHGDFSMDS